MISQTLTIIGRILLSVVILLTIRCDQATAQSKRFKLQACLVQLSDSTSHYQEVLSGPPETASMESGLVVLFPSTSVGKHSTKSYVLSGISFQIPTRSSPSFHLPAIGSGEMRITGGQTLKLKPNVVAYCPPMTEHDVVNTGPVPLRYLYIVAKREH